MADFALEFTLVAHRKFDTPVVSTHSQREWNLSSIGLDGDMRAQVWQEINESPDFWFKLKSLCTPEELTALEVLCHDPESSVHFITSRCGKFPDEQTVEWLHRMGVCAEAVHVVEAYENKPELAKGLGVTVAIDDRPETVIGYRDAGVPNVYLMRRQYNQPFDESGIKTVGSFIEFIWDDCNRRGVFGEPKGA